VTSDDDLAALARRSAAVISSHQHTGGAYPASPVFPVYRYSWFRDGSFIADAMSRVGFADSADSFFGWCSRIIIERSDQIDRLIARAAEGETVLAAEHLPTRFTLDGALTGEEWWDFQLDGYGTWIWALVEHGRRHGRDLAPYRDAVESTAEYLCAFWDQPCYDWWEEHPDAVHPSTLACVSAGLRAAIDAGLVTQRDGLTERCRTTVDAIGGLLTPSLVGGHLVKSIGRTDVDASLIACATPLGVIPPGEGLAEATYAKVLADLAPDGVHRYLEDVFYGGGRWVVLAGFVGWYEAETGRTDRARARLEWMHRQATPEGLLPEQVTEHSLYPEHIPEWIDKWGPVATPLLWSHAMYLSLAHALGLVGDLTT
jgi:GH15 family glucan-1,4-alpha-glucosidase